MREDLFDKLDEHGIDLGIGKPIIPSVLLNGILDIFNLKAVASSQPSASKSRLARLDKPISLLAEDNKTNQLIASHYRTSGDTIYKYLNGKEAVEKYRSTGIASI